MTQLQPKTTKQPTEQTLYPSVSKLVFFLCDIQFTFLTCPSSTAFPPFEHSGSPTLHQFSRQQHCALYNPNNTVECLSFSTNSENEKHDSLVSREILIPSQIIIVRFPQTYSAASRQQSSGRYSADRQSFAMWEYGSPKIPLPYALVFL